MAKHTEGPWTSHELEDGRFSVVHWGPLAYVGADEPGVAEANARLMAAAPDLLEALDGMVQCIDAFHDTSRPIPSYLSAWYGAARAAIAKAVA